MQQNLTQMTTRRQTLKTLAALATIQIAEMK